MEEKKNYQMQELYDQAIDDLKCRLEWNKKHCIEDEEIEDLITEVADNNIPIYTYDLLQYASNNFDLIQPNDLAGEYPDVIKIIQCNIYEMLTEHLYNHINNKVKVKEIK